MWSSGFTCTAKEKIPFVADFITVYTWSVGLRVPFARAWKYPFYIHWALHCMHGTHKRPLLDLKKTNFALSSAWRKLIYFWRRGGSKIRPNFVTSNVYANAPVTYLLWRSSLIPNKQWIKNKKQKKNQETWVAYMWTNTGWSGCVQRSMKGFFLSSLFTTVKQP